MTSPSNGSIHSVSGASTSAAVEPASSGPKRAVARASSSSTTVIASAERRLSASRSPSAASSAIAAARRSSSRRRCSRRRSFWCPWSGTRTTRPRAVTITPLTDAHRHRRRRRVPPAGGRRQRLGDRRFEADAEVAGAVQARTPRCRARGRRAASPRRTIRPGAGSDAAATSPCSMDAFIRLTLASSTPDRSRCRRPQLLSA